MRAFVLKSKVVINSMKFVLTLSSDSPVGKGVWYQTKFGKLESL